MSLINEQTGQPATPLAEISKRSQDYRSMTGNQLLREALAMSNGKCNNLIAEQNTLIEGLTQQVKKVKLDNEIMSDRLSSEISRYNKEMSEVVAQERQFKAEISKNIRETVTTTASEVTVYFKGKVDNALKEVKSELKETTKEIEKQRDAIQFEGKFRRFMFWATPVLLFVMSIFTVVALLK